MSNNNTGTIFLTTATAIALWNGELRGQFSDGMWENSRPHDHWMFWCRLDVRLGAVPKTIRSKQCFGTSKTRYAFERLLPIVGDRMLEIGKEIDSNYTMKAMKADLQMIKLAMNSIEIEQ